MQTSPQLFILAFVFVLALIGLAAWLVRRFSGKGLGSAGSRGRAPRLAVVDAAAVDGRRRLVLVRRDNIEHLLMIGGPTDIVVEANIVRGVPGRDTVGRDASVRGSEHSRAPEFGVADHDSAPEPHVPEFTPRPPRPLPDDIRRPPAVERRGESPANAEPAIRPEPSVRTESRPEPRLEPRSEPQPARTGLRSEPLMPRAPSLSLDPVRAPMARANVVLPPIAPAPIVPPAAPAAAGGELVSEADQNLADMAKRLEAALRRPNEPAASAPEPRIPPEPRFAPPPGPPSAAPPVNPPSAAPSIKTGFENLEDEMASLLGRPKSPS